MLSAVAGHWVASSVVLHIRAMPFAITDDEDTPGLLEAVMGKPMEGRPLSFSTGEQCIKIMANSMSVDVPTG